jgi:hypothetical protein
MAIAGTRKETISSQVVKAVHVELAREEILLPGRLIVIIRVDQLGDTLGERVIEVSAEDLVNFR